MEGSTCVSIQQLRRLLDTSTGTAVLDRVRTGYDAGVGQWGRSIRRNLRGREVPPSSEDFAIVRRRTILAVLDLGEGAKDTANEEGAREALNVWDRTREYVQAQERASRTPLDDIDTRTLTLRTIAPEVSNRYIDRWSTDLARRTRETLQQAEAQRWPADMVALRLRELIGMDLWRLERIVRTEHSSGYNALQVHAVRALSRHYPDVRKRWTELVDDHSGEPLDGAVAMDSIVMHGQVASVDGMFEMPMHEDVHYSMWGKRWAHPPNRPNDRAVVTPWRPSWRLPAYDLTPSKDGGPSGDRRIITRGESVNVT